MIGVKSYYPSTCYSTKFLMESSLWRLVDTYQRKQQGTCNTCTKLRWLGGPILENNNKGVLFAILIGNKLQKFKRTGNLAELGDAQIMGKGYKKQGHNLKYVKINNNLEVRTIKQLELMLAFSSPLKQGLVTFLFD